MRSMKTVCQGCWVSCKETSTLLYTFKINWNADFSPVNITIHNWVESFLRIVKVFITAEENYIWYRMLKKHKWIWLVFCKGLIFMDTWHSVYPENKRWNNIKISLRWRFTQCGWFGLIDHHISQNVWTCVDHIWRRFCGTEKNPNPNNNNNNSQTASLCVTEVQKTYSTAPNMKSAFILNFHGGSLTSCFCTMKELHCLMTDWSLNKGRNTWSQVNRCLLSLDISDWLRKQFHFQTFAKWQHGAQHLPCLDF